MAGGDDPVLSDDTRRRRAWERVKEVLGSEDLAEQLTRLEQSRLGCPRTLLCACVDRFLRLPGDARQRAVEAYLASTAFPAAELIPVADRSPEEALACEIAFREAMRRVMGEPADDTWR